MAHLLSSSRQEEHPTVSFEITCDVVFVTEHVTVKGVSMGTAAGEERTETARGRIGGSRRGSVLQEVFGSQRTQGDQQNEALTDEAMPSMLVGELMERQTATHLLCRWPGSPIAPFHRTSILPSP